MLRSIYESIPDQLISATERSVSVRKTHKSSIAVIRLPGHLVFRSTQKSYIGVRRCRFLHTLTP